MRVQPSSRVATFCCFYTPQLLVTSNFGMQSFTPDAGKLLWQYEWQSSANNPRNLQPLLTEPNVVMFATNDKGALRVEVNRTDSDWTLEEQWSRRRHRRR